ncbi:MAG TPA: GTP-binding protein [Archaeoglobus profundus]|nr:GTP-binding protein [Archaeoglobus profundus]
MKKVALVGNPNVGKSVIFNALTGGRQSVGNWPGTTVEKKEGVLKYKGMEFHVADLPGIYSFAASSIDEKIARDYILQERPDVVVNVVDASNLERNLYLTMQLIEMEVTMVVALNKMDLAKSKGYKIDVKKLSKELGLPVIPMIAVKNKGIEELKEAIYYAAKQKFKTHLRYNDEIEKVIEAVERKVVDNKILPNYPPRFVAIKLLEGDEEFLKMANVSEEVVKEWITQKP